MGKYREIVEPECILSTDGFADEEGNGIPATRFGMGTEFLLTNQPNAL